MGVDVAHLVQEAAGDTDDQVVDDGADGAEGSDTLAGTVVQLDRDDVLLGATEGDGNVGEVLNELAAGTLDGHSARTNVDLHCRKRTSRISLKFPKIVPRSSCSRLWSNMAPKKIPPRDVAESSVLSEGDSDVSLRSGILIHEGSRMCAHLPLHPQSLIPRSMKIQEKKSHAHHCPEWAAVPRSGCTAS